MRGTNGWEGEFVCQQRDLRLSEEVEPGSNRSFSGNLSFH